MYNANQLMGEHMAGQLPDDIVQAIEISNAKSIGELPVVVASGGGGADGRMRLGDFGLSIDGQGRLVIELLDQRSVDIFIPGNFTRENVQVSADSSRGVTVRVRKSS
jgi:hypothetical protein